MSKINKTYKFPRISDSSRQQDESEEQELEHVTFYDLREQNKH
jgi:hypothetical protein